MSAAMKPILFSTPMVQAILDCRKTMTRRVVNLKKFDADTFVDNGKIYRHEQLQGMPDGSGGFEIEHEHVDITMFHSKYQVGDVLWVRETWQYYCLGEQDSGFIYKASPELYHWKKESVIWKPSIFMPKEACRIFLRVTNVRVERLQDISEDDAQKEGVEPLFDFTDVCPETGNPCSDFKTPF